jgi:hypothetical protein
MRIIRLIIAPTPVPREPEDNVLLILFGSEAFVKPTVVLFSKLTYIYWFISAQMYYFLQNIKIILQINKK